MKKYAGSGSLRAGAMPACGGKKEEATGTGAAAGPKPDRRNYGRGKGNDRTGRFL